MKETIEVFGDPNIESVDGVIKISVELARILEKELAQLKEALKVIEFYGYEFNHHFDVGEGRTKIINDRGKRARDFITNIKKGSE